MKIVWEKQKVLSVKAHHQRLFASQEFNTYIYIFYVRSCTQVVVARSCVMPLKEERVDILTKPQGTTFISQF